MELEDAHSLSADEVLDKLGTGTSGLSEEEGWKHPTIGGLRIGKRLPVRKPSEPFDELLEWERDGQYYHYLTRWMHALNRVSQVTGNPTYNLWAIELAKTAHKAFVYEAPDGRKRMYWKMSIDLSRPLVASMGQHDPLDGFVTYNELQASAPNNPDWPNLLREIGEIEELCREISWVTDDPLAVGGLLWSSYFLAKLIADGHPHLKTYFDLFINAQWDLLKHAYLFKADTFAEEEEWRILSTWYKREHQEELIQHCDFYARNNSIVPYIELDISSMKETLIPVVFTGAKNETPYHTLDRFLKKNGYMNTKLGRSSVTYR